MPYVHLDVKSLHHFNKEALGLLYSRIAQLWQRELSREEVRRIYEEGASLIITGDAFYSTPELNYACFFEKAARRLPLKLTVRCFASISSTHNEIVHSSAIDRLIVAGILIRGKFDSYSSSWRKVAPIDSGEYYLGSFINTLILRYYAVLVEA